MNQPTTRKTHWIPWAIVGFFGVIVAVNATMVFLAVTTFTGLDREEPYLRGVGYNEVLAEERRQEALGWQAAVEAESDRLTVELADQLDQPLTGAVVHAHVTRPVDAGLDFVTDLAAVAPGRYLALLDWPAKGRWDVLVTVEQDGRYFQEHRRLIVR